MSNQPALTSGTPQLGSNIQQQIALDRKLPGSFHTILIEQSGYRKVALKRAARPVVLSLCLSDMEDFTRRLFILGLQFTEKYVHVVSNRDNCYSY